MNYEKIANKLNKFHEIMKGGNRQQKRCYFLKIEETETFTVGVAANTMRKHKMDEFLLLSVLQRLIY